MEKETMTKPDESQYFDELLTRIRTIRSSDCSAVQKISDIITFSADFDGHWILRRFAGYLKQLNEQGATERFANKLLLYAESSVRVHHSLLSKDIEALAREFNYDNSFKQDIYDYPSYQGDHEEVEDVEKVSLSGELQNFKGRSMVLKTEDLDRIIDTFCSRNTYYRRAYAILADLDKQILECVSYT